MASPAAVAPAPMPPSPASGRRRAPLTPRQLARQLKSEPVSLPPPSAFGVVYKRGTRAQPGTQLAFGNSARRERGPPRKVGPAPTAPISGTSGEQHAHQWQHASAREGFLGRSREHGLAVHDWQRTADLPTDTLGSSALMRSTGTPRASRAVRPTFSPRDFRTALAQREGRAVEDDVYYLARRKARVQLHGEELADRDAAWGRCKPWVDAHRRPPVPQWQKSLHKGRRELKKIEQKRFDTRVMFEKKTRKLLKDCGFLLERLADHEDMHTMEAKAELAKHATFINRTNTTLRNGEMTCQAKFDQVVTFHRLILVALFQLMDEDGGGVLDMMEIRILARAMGVKLTDGELKDAMAEMVSDANRRLSRLHIVSSQHQLKFAVLSG